MPGSVWQAAHNFYGIAQGLSGWGMWLLIKCFVACIALLFGTGLLMSVSLLSQTREWQTTSQTLSDSFQQLQGGLTTGFAEPRILRELYRALHGPQDATKRPIQNSGEVWNSRASRRRTRKTPQKEVDPYSDQWDNSIAVCAIMKKEEVADILEWVQYHKWIGADKIYLRENSYRSERLSVAMVKALQPFIDEGFLDLGTWAGQSPSAQQLWYNRCAQGDLAGAHSWILFTDLDEFPVLLNEGVAQENPDLKAFMRRQRGAAGLSLQWVMFGSSGLRDRPSPGGPLRYFRQCNNELSFEMKCIGASHFLAEQPFVAPNMIHACCYRYDADEDPEKWPAVLYGGNGGRVQDDVIKPVTLPVPLNRAQYQGVHERQECRTYRGHLSAKQYERTRDIPDGEALVLFHYLTRSFEDFHKHKLTRYAGWHTNEFRHRREDAAATGGPIPSDEDIFDDLEYEQGIDRDAAVCSSAVDALYGEKCCNSTPT